MLRCSPWLCYPRISVSNASLRKHNVRLRRSRYTYIPSEFDNIESLESYLPGGLHPVFPGDILGRGRYKILHKLGFGDTSTVWLARDLQPPSSSYNHGKTLVALKVIAADLSTEREAVIHQTLVASLRDMGHPASQRIQTPLDDFVEAGPNGSHLCIVTPLLGPAVAAMSDWPFEGSRRLRSDLARQIAKAVALSVEGIHAAGFVHGDLSTHNILLHLSEDIHLYSDDVIYAVLGEPQTDRVCLNGKKGPPQPHAPKEVVEPLKTDIVSPWIRTDITLIDFGQSYPISSRPKDYKPSAALRCAPPELTFEPTLLGPPSDVWMLGCTIFEIRAGFSLFDSFLGTESYIHGQMIETLGKLPDRWGGTIDPPSSEAGQSSIAQKLRTIGLDDAIGYGEKLHDPSGTMLAEEEVWMLSDLLSRMMRYELKDRITMGEVLQHPWFLQQQ